MMDAGLRMRDRHRGAFVLGVALLGALLALVAIEAIAALANMLGFTALHDVGVNTGPIAAVGGGAAGAGAGAGGGGGHPGTGEPQDPSLVERLLSEIGRRIEGHPAPVIVEPWGRQTPPFTDMVQGDDHD